jgi:hypothetical protein
MGTSTPSCQLRRRKTPSLRTLDLPGHPAESPAALYPPAARKGATGVQRPRSWRLGDRIALARRVRRADAQVGGGRGRVGRGWGISCGAVCCGVLRCAVVCCGVRGARGWGRAIKRQTASLSVASSGFGRLPAAFSGFQGPVHVRLCVQLPSVLLLQLPPGARCCCCYCFCFCFSLFLSPGSLWSSRHSWVRRCITRWWRTRHP